MPCTKSQTHQAVANWSGVPVERITEETELDGLGGRSWPGDAEPLIAVLQELCDCVIPAEQYEKWKTVEDMDRDIGAR